MSFQERDFQDFINQNYLPLALLINVNGDILTINEAAKNYFKNDRKHISEIFSDDFLHDFKPFLEECIKTGNPQRIPSFFNFKQPSKKQFTITISSYEHAKKNNQFCVLFQTVIGAIPSKLNENKDKTTNFEHDLQEFVDELQTANEEINASNEELTTLNEELYNYKNHLEELVEERTNELDIQRAQLKNIINNLPGSVLKYKLDKKGNDSLLFISEKIEDIWEVSREDALADMKNLWDITFQEDIISTKNSIAKSAVDVTPWNQQWRIKTKSGKVKWLEGIGVPEKMEDGSVGWDTIILDISDRKRAELELKEKSALLQRTESVAKIGSWELNIENSEIRWSQEIFNIFELDSRNGTPSYKELSKLFTPPSFEILDTHIKRAIDKGIPYEVEVQIKVSDGVKYCIARGYANKNQKRGITQLYGSFQDISSIKNKDFALVKQAQLLAKTEKVAQIGSWEWDLRSDKMIWTAELFNIFEKDNTKEARPYSNHSKNYIGDSYAKLDAGIKYAISSGSPFEVEVELMTDKGNKKFCLSRGYAKKNEEGEVVKIYGLFQDITKRKSAELALKHQKEVLEKTQAMARIGSWEWEIEGDVVTWSKELYDIFGYDPTKGAPNYYTEHYQLYTDKSLEELNRNVENSIKNAISFETELEAITSSGEIKYCISKGFPRIDEKGQVTHLFGFLQDVSKLKQIDTALRQQKDVLERTEAVAQIGSWEWDIVEDKVYWSDEIFRIYEMDPANGAPAFKDQVRLYSKESLQDLKTAIDRTVKYGLPYELELEVYSIHGKRKFCIARGYAQKNKNGEHSHLYGSFQDVTHKKIAEIRWKESQEDYKAITDSVPGVVLKYQLNADGTDKLIYLSKGVEDLHEIEHELALNNVSLIWQRIHPEDLDKFIASIQESAQNLSFWNIEYRLLLPDGKVKWAQGRGMPKKTEEGAIVWNTLIMDITEKVIASEELKSLNDQLDLAIDTARLGVWALDMQSGKLDWNDRHLEIYGISRDEFENRLTDWQNQLHPEDAEHANSRLTNVMNGEKVSGVEFRVIRPNGEIRHVIASGAPLISDGEIVKLVGVIIDVTTIKLYENELIKAKEKAESSEAKVREKNEALEKANAELDRFVYSVSHDLRAPIASAVGLSELSLSSNDLGEIQHLNGLKIKTLNRLDQFIKDILDYSRNSRLELKIEALNFKEIIDLMLIEYHQDIKEKNIDVKVNIKGEKEFYTDKLRISIILNNLISNAFKFLNDYGDHKRIEIDIKSNKKEAEIMVRDNGLGIEEHRIEKIFDMFYRANDQKPGSGIGLYILKECLDKLGGEIDIESQVNKGTTFYLKIPVLK